MRSKENERKVGTALSYVNTVLQALLGFVYVPLLLSYLGTSQFGIYQLMGSLIAYFSIMDFGLSTAVIRFYIYYYQKSSNIFQTFLATVQKVYICISLFTIMIGGIIYSLFDVIFKNGLTPQEIIDAKSIFVLLLINIVITLLGMLYRAIITANENFLFLKSMETVQLVFQPVAVIAVINAWPTAFAVALVMTVINLILTMVRYIYCRRMLQIKISIWHTPFDFGILARLKDLMTSTFVVSIVDQIFLKSNQVILGIISGTGSVAIYSIAAIIYTSYLSLSYAISGVFLPKITQLILSPGKEKEVSSIFIKIGRFQFVVYGLVLTGFIIFGREFINIWAGSEFTDAWQMALIIMIPYTIDMIQNIGLSILQAKDMYGIRARVYGITGILSIILSVYFGNRYGAFGCAVATAFSILASNFIMNCYYYKTIHLEVFQFWKSIFYIALVMAPVLILGILINYIWTASNILVLIFKIIIYTVLYAFVTYLLVYKKGKMKLQ
ncbi:oligosaccharide flippase family protein [Dialister succinatiphilus]|uniref:oligosaccharide flippase family protein n=1 Tax=Dialister succinatiphilus TaxID=487173 RepID=UPI002357A852|nr:oligosaccharide flippase family protein [Dialister succinatiphilus]